MNIEIKKVSVNKINKRFIKKYGDLFDTYYWKIKVKDTDTKKTYKFKAAITADYIRSFMVVGETQDTELIEEVKEKLENYLINEQEVYLGEDGDFYIVGEDPKII